MPEIYKRYTDDGIGETSLSYNQLLGFINFVQHFHPAVKFTYEISEKSVTFLDMKISLKQGKLTTSVQYKPTDSHSYLDYRSSHTPQYQNSIPFSQFLGLNRVRLRKILLAAAPRILTVKIKFTDLTVPANFRQLDSSMAESTCRLRHNVLI